VGISARESPVSGHKRAAKSPNHLFDRDLLWSDPGDPNPVLGYGYNDGSSFPDPAVDGGLGRRHGKKGGVVLAVDGHVEIIKYETWRREAQVTTKNRMYCNPGTPNGR